MKAAILINIFMWGRLRIYPRVLMTTINKTVFTRITLIAFVFMASKKKRVDCL